MEVPSEQYDDAIKLMKTKIRQGKIPGVREEDAEKLVVRGEYTYDYVKRLAEPGTFESLTSAFFLRISPCGIGFARGFFVKLEQSRCAVFAYVVVSFECTLVATSSRGSEGSYI